MIAFVKRLRTNMLLTDQIIFLFFHMPIKLNSKETAEKETINKRTIKQIDIIFSSTTS